MYSILIKGSAEYGVLAVPEILPGAPPSGKNFGRLEDGRGLVTLLKEWRTSEELRVEVTVVRARHLQRERTRD